MNTRQTHFKQMSNKDSKVPASKLKKHYLRRLERTILEKKIKDVTRALEITSSSVSFTEFLKISDKIASNSATMTHSVKGSTVHVSNEHGAKHQFSKEETAAFARHINNTLSHDKSSEARTSTSRSTHMDLFLHVRDGILLAKLINEAVADTDDVCVVRA